MSEKFNQHFCEFEIKMTQHFSVFQVKMTLTGLTSNYLASSVIVLLRYILNYRRILFIINRGTVHYTISMS